MQNLLDEKIQIPSSPPAPPGACNPRTKIGAFLLAASIPVALLLGFTVSKSQLLLYGHEVCINARVVDPFDLFRGNYLQIQAANVDANRFEDGQQVFVVYQDLALNSKLVEVDAVKPSLKSDQFMLKGVVRSSFGGKTVVFPFSKAFISAESASKSTGNLTANLSVNNDGDAVLVSLLADGRKL